MQVLRSIEEQWNESALARQYSVPCWDCPVLRMLGRDALRKRRPLMTFVHTWPYCRVQVVGERLMYVPSAGYCLAVVVAGLSASLVILQLGVGFFIALEGLASADQHGML